MKFTLYCMTYYKFFEKLFIQLVWVHMSPDEIERSCTVMHISSRVDVRGGGFRALVKLTCSTFPWPTYCRGVRRPACAHGELNSCWISSRRGWNHTASPYICPLTHQSTYGTTTNQQPRVKVHVQGWGVGSLSGLFLLFCSSTTVHCCWYISKQDMQRWYPTK